MCVCWAFAAKSGTSFLKLKIFLRVTRAKKGFSFLHSINVFGFKAILISFVCWLVRIIWSNLAIYKNIFVMKLPDVRGHHRNNEIKKERLENISLPFILPLEPKERGKIPKLRGNEEWCLFFQLLDRFIFLILYLIRLGYFKKKKHKINKDHLFPQKSSKTKWKNKFS